MCFDFFTIKEESIQKILGSNIKKYKIQKGMTQNQLAEKIDVSFRYIGFIENGQSYPSPNVLDSISKELNVPIYVFFMKKDSITDERKEANKKLITDVLNDAISKINESLR